MTSSLKRCEAKKIGDRVELLLRPSGAHVIPSQGSSRGVNCLQGVVEDVVFQGEKYRVQIRCGEEGVGLQVNLEERLEVGEPVTLEFEKESIVCLE